MLDFQYRAKLKRERETVDESQSEVDGEEESPPKKDCKQKQVYGIRKSEII